MAIFPGAVATDSDLFVAVNQKSTTLTDNPLSNVATTVNVTSTSGFPTVGFISIDAEIIKYTGTTATSFTGCTRGSDGTTANTHVLGATIYHNVVAAHHNANKDEIKAVEQFISDLVGLSTTQLKAANGSVSAPAFSFAAQTNTGMYQTGGSLRFSSNGVLGLSLGNTGAIVQLGMTDGSDTIPALSFINDSNTGLYSFAANQIGFTADGANVGIIGVFSGVAQFQGRDGSVAAPYLSFVNDPDTGIYRSAADVIGFSLGGGNAGLLGIFAGASQFQGRDGSVTSPYWTFVNDPNTGFYRPGGDIISVSLGGVQSARFENSTSPQFQLPSGSASLPGLSFISDTNNGLYLNGTDNIGVSTAGTLRWQFTASGEFAIIGGGTAQILASAGTAAAPSYSQNVAGGGVNTGMYFPGASTISFSTNSTTRLNITNTDVTATVPFQATDGSAASPSFTFNNDLNTGIFRAAADSMHLVTGGTAVIKIGGNAEFVTAPLPNADNTITCGDGTHRWTAIHAVNGTIQTSHSSTKSNIVDADNIEVPRGVFYERDGRRWLGYLNDSLPQEARPDNDPLANYEQAVIGALCAAVRKLQAEIKTLKGS